MYMVGTQCNFWIWNVIFIMNRGGHTLHFSLEKLVLCYSICLWDCVRVHKEVNLSSHIWAEEKVPLVDFCS